MKITPEVRAFALEQAGLRCECTGEHCRHHLRGSRCKRGLTDDNWKVYWLSEDGGATRDNVQAWCTECFGANYEPPREERFLLALEIADYTRLVEEDKRKSVTLKSVLRDVAEKRADATRGRLVYGRLEDDILLEFLKSRDAIKVAQEIGPAFTDMAGRLDLPAAGICGALHCGEVTRWRNGILVGAAVEVTTAVRHLASEGQIVLTDPIAAPLKGKIALESFSHPGAVSVSDIGDLWAMTL